MNKTIFRSVLKKVLNKDRQAPSGSGESNKLSMPEQPDPPFQIDDIFCDQEPSNQTIADIFKDGWLSAFPDKYQLRAGEINNFDFDVDKRVKWADQQIHEGLKNRSILELGPFEAYNTWQFSQLGAGRIVSIENNKINFLKCLLVKEITGIDANFLLGDFLSYLEKMTEPFDIVWASGVLYHQTDPIRFLDLLCRKSAKIFFHTHYYDAERIARLEPVRSHFIPERLRQENHGDRRLDLHCFSYNISQANPLFCGGPVDHCYWMTQEDIFYCLDYWGFKHITMEVDSPEHVNGPAMCFLAEKER